MFSFNWATSKNINLFFKTFWIMSLNIKLSYPPKVTLDKHMENVHLCAPTPNIVLCAASGTPSTLWEKLTTQKEHTIDFGVTLIWFGILDFPEGHIMSLRLRFFICTRQIPNFQGSTVPWCSEPNGQRWSSEEMLRRLLSFSMYKSPSFQAQSSLSCSYFFIFVLSCNFYSVKCISLQSTDRHFFIVGSRSTVWIRCLNIWLLISDLIFTKYLVLKVLRLLWFSLLIQRMLWEWVKSTDCLQKYCPSILVSNIFHYSYY